MRYDHIICASERLEGKGFHLSCGFYETTSFLFEGLGFAVVIHCRGQFTFYSLSGEKLQTLDAKRMDSGRGCYMDVLITTTGDGVLFQLPEYDWIDHYPNCDSESDRWDAVIIGIRDQLRYPA